MSDQPCCAHLHVSYRTREEGVGHVVEAWWECDSGCGQRFTVRQAPKVVGLAESVMAFLDENVRRCGHGYIHASCGTCIANGA